MPRSEQVPETVIKHSDSELLVDVVVCCSFVCNVSARIERLGRAERDEPTTMDWSFESRSLQFSWILWHSSTAMSQAFYNRWAHTGFLVREQTLEQVEHWGMGTQWAAACSPHVCSWWWIEFKCSLGEWVICMSQDAESIRYLFGCLTKSAFGSH
nr:uncharacterized protein LOC112290014 [Physcomitrium patens]|eukprot:XP_024391650.1 uncharacterized protein LOC112290014 [Physcomitrella patens]